MLLLDNAAVQKVLDVGACLNALEDAYRAQATGLSLGRQRTQMQVPLRESGLAYYLKTMEGAFADGQYATLRLTSDVVSERPVGGVARREKLARGPGGTYCGLIMVFSVEHLEPVALLHDGFLQVIRVACTSALSTRLMARPDAATLGLLGSSGQAWAHLLAIKEVRNIRHVRVYSPNPEHRAIFVERAQRELGLSAEAVENARAAVSGSDLVVAATNTSQPIVDGSWLAPGSHVISIVSGDEGMPRRELDNEVFRRAALVVAHTKEGARRQPQGDLWEAVEAGILKWEDIPDLCELVAGRRGGRANADDITVFKNNVGLGLQFAAIAPRIYELARAAGIGRELPSEWFLQDMKP